MAASNSPYSTAIASSKIDFDFESSLNPSEQMRKYKTEEKEAQAPHTLPFEFGDLPQNLANIVDNAFEASSNLENILKTEKYQKNKDLIRLKMNLEQIIMYLMKNGDKMLEKFTIGVDKN
jgi:hypothetical protein